MRQFLPGNGIGIILVLSQFHWSISYRRTTTEINYKYEYERYKLVDDENQTIPPYESLLPKPANHTGGLMLFNFTDLPHVQNWSNINDNFYPNDSAAQSSAEFYTIWAPRFQRVILYSWMNPKDEGRGYAGAGIDVNFNLSDYDRLVMYGYAWKSNSGHKVVLFHNGQHNDTHPNYHLKFNTKTDDSVMMLNLSDFKPYIGNRHIPDAPPLNKGNITRIELRVIAGGGGDGKGGYYWDPELKYGGIGRLELEWIKADKIKKEGDRRKNKTRTRQFH